MRAKDSIPNYDIVRNDTVGRYVVIDPYMTGEFRFSVGSGERECVMRQSSKAVTDGSVPFGSREIRLDRKLSGVSVDSYVKIGHRFYLVEGFDKNTLYTEKIQEEIGAGTKVELYSIPVDSDSSGNCVKVKFGVTTLYVGSDSMYVDENSTPQDVLDRFSGKYVCWYNERSGFLYFATSGYSTDTEYYTYSEYPVDSQFVNVLSPVRMAPGDDILLFNEGIEGSQSCRVLELSGEKAWNGFRYTAHVDKLNGKYRYSQLRAYPAYFSRKLSTGTCGPYIPDVCYATVFGKESEVVVRYVLYSGNTRLNKVPADIRSVPNAYMAPSSLLLSSEMVSGSVKLVGKSIEYTCDREGDCEFRIRSGIPGKYRMKFDGDLEVSVTGFDGSVQHCGNTGSYVVADLENATFHLRGNAGSRAQLTYVESVDQVADAIEYYVIARQEENSRVEANCLHLNPVYRDYRELVAIIGSSRAGDGHIAI